MCGAVDAPHAEGRKRTGERVREAQRSARPGAAPTRSPHRQHADAAIQHKRTCRPTPATRERGTQLCMCVQDKEEVPAKCDGTTSRSVDQPAALSHNTELPEPPSSRKASPQTSETGHSPRAPPFLGIPTARRHMHACQLRLQADAGRTPSSYTVAGAMHRKGGSRQSACEHCSIHPDASKQPMHAATAPSSPDHAESNARHVWCQNKPHAKRACHVTHSTSAASCPVQATLKAVYHC
jgi:hypothetical protein